MKSKKFQRNIEDFTCDHCGTRNYGDGFTNHCFSCLWSKHVDVNPGDREALCRGMMKPVSVEGTAGKYDLVHVCERCGLKKKNRVEEKDDFDEVLKIVGEKK